MYIKKNNKNKEACNLNTISIPKSNYKEQERERLAEIISIYGQEYEKNISLSEIISNHGQEYDQNMSNSGSEIISNHGQEITDISTNISEENMNIESKIIQQIKKKILKDLKKEMLNYKHLP